MGTRDLRCRGEGDWDAQQAAEAGGPPWVRVCAHWEKGGQEEGRYTEQTTNHQKRPSIMQ